MTSSVPVTATFKLDAQSAGLGRKIEVLDDGVYFRASGLAIYLR